LINRFLDITKIYWNE